MLVLGFDAGKEFEKEKSMAQLIADQRGAITVLAVEPGRNLQTANGERAVVVITAVGADGAQAPATFVESLAEGVTQAHISAGGVVVRIETREDFQARRALHLIGARRLSGPKD